MREAVRERAKRNKQCKKLFTFYVDESVANAAFDRSFLE